MTSRYNGMEFEFNIYKDHVASNLSKFNDDSDIINEEFTFYNGYKAYYRPTKELNGVIIEAEVKRFKKAEFISSIENQLGYIPNIKLLISDAEVGSEPTERPFSHEIIFQNEKLIVGSYSSYSVPQILLTPGEGSPIRISYGTINFEELEMKKYSGNVSFIMNINDVDVTPSRESVVWNNKTREAIKNSFLAAQKTITDIIEDRMKNMSNLPDYVNALAKFRSNNGDVEGMSELYKIVDSSAIKTSYKKFAFTAAAIQITDDVVKKKVVFTSTQSIYQYSYTRRKVLDTSYTSTFSSEYIGKLSQHAEKEVFIFIGKTKFKGIARYVQDKYSLEDNNVSIVFIDEEYYKEFTDILGSYDIDEFMDPYYNKGNYREVIMAELHRYIENNQDKVVLEDEIDKAKMTALGVQQDEDEKNESSRRYLSHAERSKLAGKVVCRKHNYGKGTSQYYYNEETIISENIGNIYIYNLSDSLSNSLLNSFNADVPDGCSIIGISDANFKRFYKVEGIKLLTDGLFNIEFGELSLTELGRALLGNGIYASDIADCFGNPEELLGYSSLGKLLKNKFKDFKKSSGQLDSLISSNIMSLKRDIRYKNKD